MSIPLTISLAHVLLLGRLNNVPIRHAAATLSSLLTRASLTCVHLDVFHKAAALQQHLGSELGARGIRVFPALSAEWRPSHRSALTGASRSSRYDGHVASSTSMEANLARLHTARHSALLVLELGTQWGDLI